MSNVNSPTDGYFLQPDFSAPGGTITKAAVPTAELVRDVQYINPLSVSPAVYQRNLGEIRVSQQLTKRRFYFSCVFDQVQRWEISAEIVFLQNNSPVLTWPLYWADIMTRAGGTSGLVQTPVKTLLAVPQDTPTPPYWVDVQKATTVTYPLLSSEYQTDVPANEQLVMLPLATCPQINTVDSVMAKFPAIGYTPGIAGTQALVFYTVVMFPTHLNILCDRIQFNLKRATFVPDTTGAAGAPALGFIWAMMACESSRY